MKRLLIPSLLIVLSLLIVPSLFAAETHRYIVGTTRIVGAASIHVLANAAEAGERNVRTFQMINGFAADLTDAEAVEMRKQDGVRYVSRTIEIHAAGNVTTHVAPLEARPPLADKQTIPPNIDLIHARDVWPATRGGNVNVVVFDTGVDIAHADLTPNIAGGYNTFTKDNDFNDDNHHGTHVFGIIGAADNNLGVVGVAPGAHIYMAKVLAGDGSGTDENLVAAADWLLSVKHARGGNWIVSMSLGSYGISDAETDAFKRLNDEGVLCIAAAGNDGTKGLLYPAALPNIVSVGAVDNNKVIANFSNTDPSLNVVAPGVSILSTLPTRSVKRATTTVANGPVMTAATIAGAPFSDVTGEWIFCNFGFPEDFPAETRGRIAVIMRGMSLAFSEKVRNALAAGAIGAVIINNHTDTVSTNWTLINPICDGVTCHDDPKDLAYPWPVVVAMTNADGTNLLAGPKQAISLSAYHDDYGILSGTSMAAPHVAGVAALVWSLAPTATARQVAGAIRATAIDLGPPGVDDTYGFGLVDARAAAQWLAPAAFGLPARSDVRRHGVKP